MVRYEKLSITKHIEIINCYLFDSVIKVAVTIIYNLKLFFETLEELE